MNIRSVAVAVGVAAAVILCDANVSEARGFGIRRGASVRLGIGGSRNRGVRYYGTGFYAGPHSYAANRQSTTQYQQRPWYYSRSGPVEYYRPYNPLYRIR